MTALRVVGARFGHVDEPVLQPVLTDTCLGDVLEGEVLLGMDRTEGQVMAFARTGELTSQRAATSSPVWVVPVAGLGRKAIQKYFVDFHAGFRVVAAVF